MAIRATAFALLLGFPSLRLSILLVTVALAAPGCGGKGGESLLDPNNPPPGLNTTQAALTDGVGTPGPVRARLITVSPELGSQVVANNTGSCSHQAPFPCFEMQAEVCMDEVANPNGSTLLATMQISAVFSADGVTPILGSGGFPIPVNPSADGSVAKGTCVTWLTIPGMKPPFPSAGTPRYLIILAHYGTGFYPNSDVNASACPTPAAIAAGSVSAPVHCVFRRVYDLGYHF